MVIIPGFLISILTFPGVMVHEVAHQMFCRLFRVPVYEVKYFQLKNPAGYVAHEPCDKPMANIFISIGPFIINTVVGCLIMLSSSVEILAFEEYSPISLFLAWLGLSILMNAFPSRGDAKSLYQSVVKNNEVNIIAKIIALPIIGLIYIGAFGSVFWLDFLYGAAVAFLLPNLLVHLFL